MNKAIIKLIGIGGAGGNAVDRMMATDLRGIDLIAANTDVQDLHKVRAHRKLHLGQESAKGLGAGMNPEVGRKAAQESAAQISQLLQGADMVFLAAGLGGGTGGGAAPVVAHLAKEQGALTVAVVSLPFSFEGTWRAKLAAQSLKELERSVDTLLVIPNDRVLDIASPEVTLLEAFWSADEVLRQAVQGISDLITKPGLINVDFADVRNLMQRSGRAVFGMGKAKGEHRIAEALDRALNSPFLSLSIQGARGILFNMAGLDDLSLAEVEETANILRQKASPEAKIIFGAVRDKELKPGEVKITVLACGFPRE
jgi:cell division protein FtsZ